MVRCDVMRCCWVEKRKIYIYRLWRVKVEVAKSVIQANLSEYISVLGRKKITLGRSFETNGRLRLRVSVLVIGRAAVDVTGRWLVSSGR